jgi:hypothetical protein
VKLPIWLYHERRTKYDRTRRWGSRRPLRVCVTLIDEPDTPPEDRMARALLGCVWRLHFSYGAAGGVESGHAGMRCVWEHVFYRRSGMALGIAWEAVER